MSPRRCGEPGGWAGTCGYCGVHTLQVACPACGLRSGEDYAAIERPSPPHRSTNHDELTALGERTMTEDVWETGRLPGARFPQSPDAK